MRPDAPSVENALASIMKRPAWHRQAACRGVGTDAFFPERGESTDRATAVCEGRSVREECLSAALADPLSAGIWGGLSTRGRRELRRSVA